MFLGLIKPLREKREREFHSHVFYIMSASLVSLNKAPVLIPSTVGSQFLNLSRFIVFSPLVGLFSNYMGNLSMSPTLQIYIVGHLCQNLPKSLLCRAHYSRKNLCRPFCSFLDLFVGHSLVSIHYIMSSVVLVVKIMYQFQIQLVFDLPRVG